ncbi:hypothetical protein ACQ4PT_058041 [Festuca glaucescens]
MTSEETGDEAAIFGDEFVADEILARLPARCAARGTVLSKRFRQLLTSQHFWVRHHRLGPPPEPPHVARLYLYDFGLGFEFRAVGPAFAMKHTVDTDRCSYAGTCNGLVLVSSVSSGNQGQFSVEGVVFNPATREEARLSLSLPEPQNKDVERSIMGFGYGPSTKVYKALIRELDFDGDCTRLMVVSLDGNNNGQEPRTVFSCEDDMLCRHSLHTADGKVYFLIFTMYYPIGEEGWHVENWETTSVLAFDVDDEAATSIAVPQGQRKHISDFMMLELHGRPCIYKQNGQGAVIWLLTTDHRWEQLYILANESSQRGDYFAVAWDCGGGLVLAVFKLSGAYLYNLHDEAAAEGDNEGGKRLAAVRSLPIEYKWPEQFNGIWFAEPSSLFDYRPTLISPASIISDGANLSGRPCECVVRKQELGDMFLEMTQKWVLGPAMQMLTNLQEA